MNKIKNIFKLKYVVWNISYSAQPFSSSSLTVPGKGSRRNQSRGGERRNPQFSKKASKSNPYAEFLQDDFLRLEPDELKERIDYESDLTLERLQNKSSAEILEFDLNKKRQRFKALERKFFLSKGPQELNLLTWDMKEQLKNLHFSDPDTWTPETLSEAFPISPEGVKRLLKSTNKPSTEDRLMKHDLMVLERWKKLTNGKLGSFALLRKTINKRFSDATNSNLPSVPIGTNEAELAFLEDLKFTRDEDDLFPWKEEEREKHLRKLYKKVTLKQSFASIINDYEKQVKKETSDSAGESDDVTSTYMQCQNLEEILPKSKRDHESFVKINVSSDGRQNINNRDSDCSDGNVSRRGRRTLHSSLSKKPLTYDEYKRLKSKDLG